jgi:uncharacterized protein (TIGR02246 family)
MGVASPERMPAAFLAAFNGRDKRAMLALYADDAVYLGVGEKRIVGRAAIGEEFDRMFCTPSRMTGEAVTLAEMGDIALVRMSWSLDMQNGQAPRTGVSVEVLRRGADGLWRYAIDDPTGGARAA